MTIMIMIPIVQKPMNLSKPDSSDEDEIILSSGVSNGNGGSGDDDSE